MIHELKCWPEFFREVRNGNKPFEVRKNDRNFQQNDHLLLKEWDPQTEQYTGHELKVWVPYILSNPVFVKDGYVIMTTCREWYGKDGVVIHYFK
jgi:hypothetical protein